MRDSSVDLGILTALVERLEKYRLPRALEMKESVDRGETLGDTEIEFLSEVFEDANQIGDLIDKHPEYQEIATRMLNLYTEITEKALENEKAAN